MKCSYNEFQVYCRHYKNIEEMFIKTIQYVSPTKDNGNTYSDAYAKIILLCGAEIDSIFKLLCGIEEGNVEENKNKKQYNVKDYLQIIDTKLKPLHSEYYMEYFIGNSRERMIIDPFKKMEEGAKYSGLFWWETYQKLKHDRISHEKSANLKTILCLLLVHSILIEILVDYIEGVESDDYRMCLKSQFRSKIIYNPD